MAASKSSAPSAPDAPTPPAHRFYTVLHTMVGAGRHASMDPRASLDIDSHFFLAGDVVPQDALDPGTQRLLRLGAIRPATQEEAESVKVLWHARRSSSVDDADEAAASTEALALPGEADGVPQ